MDPSTSYWMMSDSEIGIFYSWTKATTFGTQTLSATRVLRHFFLQDVLAVFSLPRRGTKAHGTCISRSSSSISKTRPTFRWTRLISASNFKLIDKKEHKLQDILSNILIRRTRHHILRWYGFDAETQQAVDPTQFNEYLENKRRAYVIVGGRHQFFPRRELETIEYSIEDTYQGLYRQLRSYIGGGSRRASHLQQRSCRKELTCSSIRPVALRDQRENKGKSLTRVCGEQGGTFGA